MGLKTRFSVLASFSPQHSSYIHACSLSIAFLHFPCITLPRISLLLNIYVSDTNRGNLLLFMSYTWLTQHIFISWWWWLWWSESQKQWHHHNYEILQQQWNQGSQKTKTHCHWNKIHTQHWRYMNGHHGAVVKLLLTHRQTDIKVLKRPLSQYYFVYHKSNADCPDNEP